MLLFKYIKIFITKKSEGLEKKKRKSIRDTERSQGEAAGDGGEADWEKAGKEKRGDA